MLVAALPPAGAADTELFQIGYGDVASDGVPGPGAGNIEVGGAEDEYRFDGAAGDEAIVDVLAGGAGAFRLSLEAPDGTLLFDGLYVDRRQTLPQTGTYTLGVRGGSATATGTYSFRLLLAPDPQEFAIGVGDTVSDGVPEAGAGNLEAPGAVDRYSLDAVAGQVAVFDALSGNNVLIRWQLEAPDGTLLFGLPLQDRQVSLTQTGTYVLTVEGNGIDDVGTYSFRVLEVPQAEEFAIGFGDTVSDGVPAPGAGNLEAPGAVDVYRFDAAAGQVAVLDALTGSTNEVRWSLNAPDGSTVFDAFYVDQQATLPQTGTYTLTVSGLNITSTGVYSFQLVEVPPQVDEFTIAFGDTVSDGVPGAGAGNIEAPLAVDRYRFDAAAGQVAVLDALTGSTNEVRWSLNAPDGSTVFDAFYVDQEATLPQTGTYTVTVSGLNITSTGVYSFQLREAPPNGPPVVTAPEDQSSVEGDTVTLPVEADDPDGDELAFSATGLPDGLAIDPDSGEIAGTIAPGASAASPYDVEVTATDPDGATATAGFHWTVTRPNTPPVAADDLAETDEGAAVTVDVLANDGDADGDAVTVESVSSPGHGQAETDGSEVVYTPDALFTGVDSFAYTVADGRGGSDQATVTVTVNAVEPPNGPPVVTAPENQSSVEGDTVTLPVEADDPDGDELAFSATGLPDGLAIDPDSGEIAGTIAPGASAASPYDVEVTATDPDGATATAGFHWTVALPSTTPVPVRIDIWPFCIHNDGHGLIPVVIYGSDSVATSRIDLSSVELEGMHIQRLVGLYAAVRWDFDHDGHRDLLVLIDNEAGAVPPHATAATLTARLRDGTAITGTDAICLAP